MKFNNILKGVAGLVLAGSMASCSSDYLDLAPITSQSSSTVSESTEGLQVGVYGVCRAMYMQYASLDGYMFMNGEPWTAAFYGEVFGQDYFSYFWANQMGNYNMNWQQMPMPGGWQPKIGWGYCYNLISMCNNILSGIDQCEGDAEEIAFRKAQVLTIRAHAYVRLLQIYGPRWQDSNNGEELCLVLRMPGDGINIPVVSMNTILNQIYSDLDAALENYGQKARKYNWEPNAQVAMGVYARAALLKEDWATAQKMAHDARQGFAIMTMEQYSNGFCLPNQEWMWNNAAESEGIYYWAFASVYGCNGPYPILWGLGAGAMNRDLFLQMDKNDGRRKLYLMPEILIETFPQARLKMADFFSSNSVNPVNMNMSSLNNTMKNAINKYGTDITPEVNGNKLRAPYRVTVDKDNENMARPDELVIAMGAQYKFWGLDGMGTGSFPFMRGAEMLLTEAEAAYHNNQPSVAIACLNELNSKRIPGYNCTTSGQALLDEIRLSRRIELWGEGFNWFDFKRWNLPVERKAWVEGDVNSGNIPSVNAGTYAPDINRGWRFAFPRSEFEYNLGVDQSIINKNN